jgi:hypothetical protein
MKKKVFEFRLNDNEGITAVALVEDPAIESNFVAFSSQEGEVKLAKDEFKQVVTGPLLIPEKLILRVDPVSKELFYAKFSKEVIEQLALKFMKEKLTDSTNEDHDESKSHKDIFMFESLLIQNEEMQIGFEKLGLEKLPIGSWVGSFKVENKETFNKIISGELRGFSIEGYLDRVLVDEEKLKKQQEDLKSDLAKAKDMHEKFETDQFNAGVYSYKI